MYESKTQSLLPRRHFMWRLVVHLLWAALLVAVVIGIGVAAHLWFEDISWHDAMLNTALIISGLGPFMLPASVAGKLFFALYGLMVSLLFVATLGLILAPVAHRMLHKFHLDQDQD